MLLNRSFLHHAFTGRASLRRRNHYRLRLDGRPQQSTRAGPPRPMCLLSFVFLCFLLVGLGHSFHEVVPPGTSRGRESAEDPERNPSALLRELELFYLTLSRLYLAPVIHWLRPISITRNVYRFLHASTLQVSVIRASGTAVPVPPAGTSTCDFLCSSNV